MTTTQTPVEHLDVLVVGAGISGIGAGRYLKTELPAKSFAILEARAASGGTWDLFRYPGIRSDSDLHTFGYEFKPWRDEQSIADAPRILEYLRETVAENGLDARIRYHHRVLAAAWSTAEARWLVDVERTDTGKRVLVIGSGATAVTLVPAMAETAAKVTMLQRTPSYVMPVPRNDALANRLRTLLGEDRAYALTRRKNIARGIGIWRFCQKYPKAARRLIRWVNTKQLPEGYPVDEHFNPPYDPWDQRLCAVPDGDLFRAIRNGTADVVTDRIETFTENGVLLASGRELEADVIVTATGLNVQAIGGISLTVDGEPVHLPDTVPYKGMMLSGVPNFALAIGYTNSSWTLKIGLLCEHFCRLLVYMDAHGYDVARPEPSDPDMPTRPFLDFAAGYVQRVVDQLPRQGDRMPWLTSMSYSSDVKLLRADSVVDPELHLFRAADRVTVTA